MNISVEKSLLKPLHTEYATFSFWGECVVWEMPLARTVESLIFGRQTAFRAIFCCWTLLLM